MSASTVPHFQQHKWRLFIIRSLWLGTEIYLCQKHLLNNMNVNATSEDFGTTETKLTVYCYIITLIPWKWLQVQTDSSILLSESNVQICWIRQLVQNVTITYNTQCKSDTSGEMEGKCHYRVHYTVLHTLSNTNRTNWACMHTNN